MKTVILSLFMAGAAHAQVFECSPVLPADQAGKATPTAARLSGGSVFWGERGGNGELHGYRKNLPDGVDVQYGFNPANKIWFVCNYGEATVWNAVNAQATACSMRQRKKHGVVTVRAECK